ncbi:MAG: hypothetical protein H0W33_05380 [Gammaproteobacteria bacterium]|nr:hypothetical protein [Gammaproteobacteria bacterium]
MQDRRKNDRRTPDRDAGNEAEQTSDRTGRKQRRSGRVQFKDGRHNVWDTAGLDDTQQLLSFLNNPELTLEDDGPVPAGEPGNPYNSTGGKALGPRKPRDDK